MKGSECRCATSATAALSISTASAPKRRWASAFSVTVSKGLRTLSNDPDARNVVGKDCCKLARQDASVA
jgi:hypothetical protein